MHQTDYDHEDRVIVRTPSGSAAIVPRSIRRLGGESLEIFADLQHAALLIQQTERDIVELVPAARAFGVSWSAIGAALGITGEGARTRFAPVVDGL